MKIMSTLCFETPLTANLWPPIKKKKKNCHTVLIFWGENSPTHNNLSPKLNAWGQKIGGGWGLLKPPTRSYRHGWIMIHWIFLANLAFYSAQLSTYVVKIIQTTLNMWNTSFSAILFRKFIIMRAKVICSKNLKCTHLKWDKWWGWKWHDRTI